MTTTGERDDAATEAEPAGHEQRHWLRRNPAFNLAYRIGVGVVGTIVLVAGIVLIPYPGPGWLVVFAGLAILATEFEWAGRVLHFAKGRYDAWIEWLKRQSTFVKILVIAGTAVVVVVSLWLFGAISLAGGWLGIDEPWMESALF